MLPSKKNLLGSLTLIASLAATQVLAAVDPCALIAGNKTATFHEAKACLDYFKFDKEIAQQTVGIIRKVTKELYVFNVNKKKKDQFKNAGIVLIQ
jgi:hypothetical protein